MEKVKYEDISNDFVNIIGLMYEVNADIRHRDCNRHEIKTYIILYKDKNVDFKLYATYYLDYQCEVDSVKLKLEKEGYINIKKWSDINKERLIRKEDILTIINDNNDRRLVLENPIDLNSKRPSRS